MSGGGLLCEILFLSPHALEGLVIGFLLDKPAGNGAFAIVIAGWWVLCYVGCFDCGLTIRNFSIILSTVDTFVKLILSVNLPEVE